MDAPAETASPTADNAAGATGTDGTDADVAAREAESMTIDGMSAAECVIDWCTRPAASVFLTWAHHRVGTRR